MIKCGITERGDAGYNFNDWLAKMPSVNMAVLITKRPDILVQKINQIPDNTIIHCSITGLKKEWEPGTPMLPTVLDSYLQLLNKFGKERVVLRVDPIIPTEFEAAIHIIRTAARINPCCRIRVSIMDLYNHVKARIEKAGIDTSILYKYYSNGIHANEASRAYMLSSILAEAPQTEICAEPGYPSTGCISERDLKILNIPVPPKMANHQRKDCQCIGQKTELLSNRGQCPNKCLYCYWR